MRTLTRLILSLLLTAAAPSAALGQSAQKAAEPAYPSRVIRIINPFSAGGPTDILARILAEQLSERWRQSVIVESKPGAGGNIAMEFTARSPADGYTLVAAVTGMLVINQYLFPSMRYDPFKDFAPISLMATIDNALIVDPRIPVNNLNEFIAYARANAGKVTYASSGVGTQPHLAAEMFKLRTGTDMLHVPFKGGTEALTATISGQISTQFSQVTAVAPFVESGKVRIIGVASQVRSPLLPNVPTLKEQGLTDFESVSIYTLMAPRGTPAPIVDKLAGEVRQILKDPAVQKRTSALGMNIVASTPEQLSQFMRSEAARYEKIIREGKIKAE